MIKKKNILFMILCLTLINGIILFAQEDKTEKGIIQDGKAVSIEYTLRLSDGSIVDSNSGKSPLVYVQGAHQIIPGLEKQLLGLKLGDERKIEVSPEEGYGKLNPEAIQEIPKNKIDPSALKVGETLVSYDPYGRPMKARIKEIKDTAVILDFNHPLAGKRLFFDVKIVKVEEQ